VQLLLRRANHATLSGIAMQHADDGYSRRVNFGASLIHGVVLIYPPKGTNICSSTGGQ